MSAKRIFGSAATALLMIALSAGVSGPSQAADRTVEGTVTYRERMALPPGAELEVRLIAKRGEDTQPAVIATSTQSVETQVPIDFEISYDDAGLDGDVVLSLSATLSLGGEAIFESPEPQLYEPDKAGAAALLLMRAEKREAGLPQDIIGAEWRVEQIDGVDIVAGRTPTLLFGDNGSAGGSGGCNRFFASLAVSGSELTFSEIGSTFMACDEAVMLQERGYFETLQRVTSYRMENGALLLLGENGRELVRLTLSA